MLDSRDLRPPEFDDGELAIMLSEAKRRSHSLRTRRAQRRSAAGILTLVGVVALAGMSIVSLQRGNGDLGHRSRGAAARTAKAPSWKLVGDLSSSWQTLPTSGYQAGINLTCPTATTCYAVDLAAQQVEVTEDGGATWQQTTLPPGITGTDTNLACSGPDQCSLVGLDSAGDSHFLTTQDAGQTWSSLPGPALLSSNSYVSALSCSSASLCVIVGFDDLSGVGPALALVTNDGGQTWAQSALTPGFAPLRIQCFISGNCIAAGFDSAASIGLAGPYGEATYSTDGGVTWSSATLPTGTSAITSISCSDSLDCSAVAFGPTGTLASSGSGSSGGGVVVTTDGGQTWTSGNTSGLPSSRLTSIACPTVSYCWVSGVVVPAGTGKAITFVKAQGMLVTSTDEGQSWQAAQLPAGIRAVAGVSCPDTTTCFAVAYSKPAAGNGSFVLLSYGS